jgi:hypothetical protein
MKRRLFLVGLPMFVSVYGRSAIAAEPQLVIDGDIQGGAEIALSDGDLAELPQNTIRTSTIWTEGVQQFSGPSLALVLERFNAGSGDLRFSAVNDYGVVADRALVSKDAPIIARRRNGQAFGRREKGPLWIIFPYDLSPDYQTENIYAASVWQLSRITVLEG